MTNKEHPYLGLCCILYICMCMCVCINKYIHSYTHTYIDIYREIDIYILLSPRKMQRERASSPETLTGSQNKSCLIQNHFAHHHCL